MKKKEDLSIEDKAQWEEYLKNPKDIFDKEQNSKKIFDKNNYNNILLILKRKFGILF